MVEDEPTIAPTVATLKAFPETGRTNPFILPTMDETTTAIPGYAHTHGFYGNDGRYRNDESCVQSQINQLADQVSANGIREAINSVGNNVVGGTASIKDTVNGVNQNVTSGNYTTLTGLNDLGRDVTNTIGKSSSDTMAGFNNSNIATLTGFNNTNSQIAEHFGQNFLQLKDLQASMERCCCDIRTEAFKTACEIKENISTDGQATRALINDVRMHDLEQANFKLSQDSQTNAIINALRSNGGGNGGGHS